MKPLFNDVIIEQLNYETASGLLLPADHGELLKGKVISAGKDCKEVKEGDIVYWMNGTGIKADGKYLMGEPNIKGKEE